MTVIVREAAVDDAPVLANLMNLAGEGIPAYLWSSMAGPGEDVMAFGARRVAAATGGFSYTNVHVAVSHGVIAGMLLGYRLPDPYETGSLDALPTVVRPLVELEAQAPGSWYVNAVATDVAYRGQGVGQQLMALAEQLAAGAGADTVSLIVADDNRGARALYQRLGYQVIARRSIIAFPGCPHTGDWLLMSKAVAPLGQHT